MKMMILTTTLFFLTNICYSQIKDQMYQMQSYEYISPDELKSENWVFQNENINDDYLSLSNEILYASPNFKDDDECCLDRDCREGACLSLCNDDKLKYQCCEKCATRLTIAIDIGNLNLSDLKNYPYKLWSLSGRIKLNFKSSDDLMTFLLYSPKKD